MATLSLQIALPVPLRQLFDYLPPAGISEQQAQALPRGIRVQVKFGKRQLTGILAKVNLNCAIAPDKLRTADAIIDQRPILADDILQLCDWASNYYHHPLGEVFAQATPTALRNSKALPELGIPGWRITALGLGTGPLSLNRAPAQKALLETIRERRELSREQMDKLGIKPAAAKALVEKQLIESCLLDLSATAKPEKELEPAATANSQQQAALARINASNLQFQCLLLRGITGSGKTEVYLHAIAEVLAQGRQALVLVPEIGLTPQTIARFERRFNHPIYLLHSGLSDNKRLQNWQLAARDEPAVVIGTRSALFATMPKLGLIIIDEEHDLSFKQQDGFRYSARDAAIMRAKLRNIPIILGSATPSLESLHNATEGRYQLLELPIRAGNALIPDIEPLDIRGQELVAGLAPDSRTAIAAQLAQGNQVLVFINRRGYAPALMCQQCGWTADCDHCDIPMTLHLARRHLRCHHCDLQKRLPEQCPSCHSRQLLSRGQGTEKLEQALSSEIQNYPVLRIDSDNMRSGSRLQSTLDQINSGKPCVLVGTQMLAKGHHFPDVTLVVIVDADSGLYSADFRSVERTGQLLIQVAGRAGRANKPGRVLLQTLQPDHELLQPLLSQNYPEFCRLLLGQRQTLTLPPFGYLAMIRCDAGDPELASKLLHQACRENPATPGASRIGPLIAPMARKAGRFRFQLIIKSDQRALLHREVHQLINWMERSREARKTRWSVDIDPQDMS